MTTRNPLGLGLVIIGALATVLGAFLPFQQSPRFGRIEQNHAGAGAVMAFIGALMIRQAIQDAAGIDEEHQKQRGDPSVERASTPKLQPLRPLPPSQKQRRESGATSAKTPSAYPSAQAPFKAKTAKRI